MGGALDVQVVRQVVTLSCRGDLSLRELDGWT
jgi:hypothetical protein